MKRVFIVSIGILLGAHANASLEQQRVTLDFGDFQSQAEWSYPSEKDESKFPAVILIHGSTPADMDFTVMGPDGQPKSSIFKDIAHALAGQGIATLRYNKHYVNGLNQVDYQRFYAKADLPLFLKDAEIALKAAESNPRIDSQRIYIYGWSEGGVVAAALVSMHPEVRGLILQGPVSLPFRETFEEQFKQVQLPYLRSIAGDALKNEDFAKLVSGKGGMVAKSGGFYFTDPRATQENNSVISAFLDTNKNGQLEIDSEVIPGFKLVMDFAFSPQGFYSIYAPGKALPTVTEQAPKLKLPILVLQGRNDANTPISGLDALKTALKSANAKVTIKTYNGLGHSLGQANSLMDDDFRPIAPQPLKDLAQWIKTH